MSREFRRRWSEQPKIHLLHGFPKAPVQNWHSGERSVPSARIAQCRARPPQRRQQMLLPLPLSCPTDCVLPPIVIARCSASTLQQQPLHAAFPDSGHRRHGPALRACVLGHSARMQTRHDRLRHGKLPTRHGKLRKLADSAW